MNDIDSPRAQAPRPSSAKGADTALPPKRLFRDPHGPVGGVAAGLAGYFDIDPVIARLLFIVAVLSGIGLPAYLVCWVVIPKAKSWPPPGYLGRPASGVSGQRHATLLSGLMVIGLAALIGHGVDGIGDFLLPAALVGFGVYLLNQRAEASAAMPEPAEPEPLYVSDLDVAGYDVTGAADTGLHTDDGRSPSSTARAGLVTPTVLSILALLSGVLLALHSANVIQVSVAGAAAGGLVVVGLGLIASLWLGRARGLIPLGLALAAVMLLASSFAPYWHSVGSARDAIMGEMGNAHSNDSVGDRHFAPASLAELQPEYNLGVGDLTVDLTQLDFHGTAREVEVHVGIGKVVVIVPEDTSVEVRGSVGIGEARAFDRKSGGLGNSVEKSEKIAGAGELIVDFSVGIGEGKVRRAQ